MKKYILLLLCSLIISLGSIKSGMAAFGSGAFGERVSIVVKEWTAFTPSIDAVTTAPVLADTHKKKAAYKVVGKSLHIIWSYSHILQTGSTDGTGDYLFPIPAGYTIDVSKVDLASVEGTFGYGTPVGNGRIMNDFGGGHLSVVVGDANNLKLIADNGVPSQYFVSSTYFGLFDNNKKILFTAEIPIL